jgi:hypothetical protein
MMPDRADDGGSTHLWNVGQPQRDYTALHPKRLERAARTWNLTRRVLSIIFQRTILDFTEEKYSLVWNVFKLCSVK